MLVIALATVLIGRPPNGACALAPLSPTGAPHASGRAASGKALLHVEGRQLSEAGAVVRLKGVNIPSFEWSTDGEFVFRSTRVALEDWHANCIRLPLSQDRWFGKEDKQKDKGEGYRDSVDEVVNFAIHRGAYVILELSGTDAGIWGPETTTHDMPDDNSLKFWHDVARTYRGQPRVLFGIYNEPHDVAWPIWRDGGDVAEADRRYHTPGMQALLEEIRKAGAKNVVIAGGLERAQDLTGATGEFALKDPGGAGVVYDAHIYTSKSGPSQLDWEQKVGRPSDSIPVIIGAFGCSPEDRPPPEEFVPAVLKFIADHDLNWTAWAMHPTAKPCLISDWIYTPTPYWGAWIKQALLPNP